VATITKTFSFLAGAESFSGSAGAASTLAWNGAAGNPLGSLKSRILGKTKSNSNYWEWTGTWEALGVPAGATVTAIRVNAASTRCMEYTGGASSSIGPYTLRDSGGTQQASLWAGRTVTATDSGWVDVSALADQSVPSAMQASNTSVKLRLANALATSSSSTSNAVSIYDDEVSIVITYSPALNTYTYSGSGGAVAAGAAAAMVLHLFACIASGGAQAGGSATTQLVTNSQIFTYAGTGGAQAGGSAPLAATKTVSGSGGAQSGGSATRNVTHAVYASGGAQNGGAAITSFVGQVATYSYLGSGGAQSGGAAGANPPSAKHNWKRWVWNTWNT